MKLVCFVSLCPLWLGLVSVQLAMLGYPSTCGSAFVDYVLTDRIITPPHTQR